MVRPAELLEDSLSAEDNAALQVHLTTGSCLHVDCAQHERLLSVPRDSRPAIRRTPADDSAPTPNANVSPAVAAANAAAAAATKYATPAPQPFGRGLSRMPVRPTSKRLPPSHSLP